MIIAIIALIGWNLLLSFLTLTAILGGYNNYKEIEAIKSWKPFVDICKIEIPEED